MFHSYLKPEDLDDTKKFEAIVLLNAGEVQAALKMIQDLHPKAYLVTRTMVIIPEITQAQLRVVQDIKGVTSVGPNRKVSTC